MATLALSSLSLSAPLATLRSRPCSSPKPPSSPFPGSPSQIALWRMKWVVCAGNSGENGSEFMDEKGMVEDMDGYLNYLSLEYDSVWDTKPSWCQPWTITLSGASAIGLSYLLLQSALVTSIATLLVFAWWFLFLYSYPKAYKEMIAERRSKVTSGVEDTFGLNKTL